MHHKSILTCGIALFNVFGATQYLWFYRDMYTVHRNESFSIFPSPSGMSLTKLSLDGNNDVIYKLFPPRESLVSDIPAGDGNIEQFFSCVWVFLIEMLERFHTLIDQLMHF